MAQILTIDMTPDEKTIHRRPTLYLSQGDVGRAFVINLFSRDNITIPNGATVKIQATKPSGLGFSVTASSVSNGVATFTSTLEMADEFGKFPAEVKITSSGVVLGTANFNVCVERNPHPDGTTDGRSEEVIPQITALVERVEAAADSIHELTVSATTLNPGASASAVYDEETNEIEFGIPRGAQLTATDDGNGNITLAFS